jgi:hypothetical protein
MLQAKAVDQSDLPLDDMSARVHLTQAERLMLVLPFLGGAIFGLAPLLVPGQFAAVTGFSGDDSFIYRLAGAATFGYAAVLWQTLRDGRWLQSRIVVAAVLAFNLVSLVACATALAAGSARPVVYLITVVSVAIVAITARILMTHSGAGQTTRDVGGWVVPFLALATVAATFFGLFPLASDQFARVFGYRGTDAWIYGEAGAACFGYAAAGVLQLRSRRWIELRLPLVMSTVFNGLSFLASVFELASGRGTLLVYVIAPASLLFTVGLLAALRRGRVS